MTRHKEVTKTSQPNLLLYTFGSFLWRYYVAFPSEISEYWTYNIKVLNLHLTTSSLVVVLSTYDGILHKEVAILQHFTIEERGRRMKDTCHRQT
jgi:hypothetical protein